MSTAVLQPGAMPNFDLVLHACQHIQSADCLAATQCLLWHAMAAFQQLQTMVNPLSFPVFTGYVEFLLLLQTHLKAEMHATCNLSLSTLNQIWMASHLAKPNPAHLCFTQSPIAESCHKVLVMNLSNNSINQSIYISCL